MSATVGPGGLLSTGAYFGRVVSRGRAPGFSLTETLYGRGEDLPRHAHERAFFCLTLDGAYTERTLRTGETAYAPWTAVFHPAGEIHTTRMGSRGGRVLNVEVDPDRLDEALGTELVATVTRAAYRDARPPRWLARVAERLADDGPAPSVRELAREAGVHPVHVARAFRRFHGVPPGTWRRRLRVRRACALLCSRGVSIAEAAAVAGFSDQSHLTRALKSVLGETPGAFRRTET